MTDNFDIYRAPQADLDATARGEDGFGHFRFYVVSQRKFLILFFATFSLYSVYWFYQNFKLNKQFLKNSDWPLPRTFFSIFFAHGLFEAIDLHIKNKGLQYEWNWRQLANSYVLIVIVGRVLDRLSGKGEDISLIDMVVLLSLFLVGGVLCQVQRAINVACLSASDDPNNALTAANWIWIGIGGVFWLLILIGLGTMVTGFK